MPYTFEAESRDIRGCAVFSESKWIHCSLEKIQMRVEEVVIELF